VRGTDITQRPISRRTLAWLLVGALVGALLIGGELVVLYARGGGPLPAALGFLAPGPVDPLAPPSPAETALRTLRLAGFDHAAVGESGGTVVVRVAMPGTADATKVQLSWQTALSAGALAYPGAGKVVAQLFSASNTPLLETSADARVIRDAARRNDAAALARATSFRYLPAAGGTP
jgi:hypothetical protein